MMSLRRIEASMRGWTERYVVKLSALKLLAVVALTCGQAHSQAGSAAAAAEQKLTGGTSRTWVFDQFHVALGANQRCTQGEAYRFFSDHRLQIQKCEGGHLTTTDYQWSISQRGALDIILSYGDERYYLLFRDTGTEHLVRLQYRSELKTQPTTDKDLRLSED